jgi:protein-S-isoprenylcysteine O-methyltransferase Ste14
MEIQIFIFLLASLGIAYLSRASLRAPRSHGFYRFFTFEAILASFLLNVRAWFIDPFSWYQLLSWVLLIASLIYVILGVRALHRYGQPDQARNDQAHLLEFEKTTRLVTDGIYRYIRHPMYSSLLHLCWGIFFKDPSWIGGALAAIATSFLLAMVKVEEAENLGYFGTAYTDYMKTTRMFIPYVL